MKRILMEEVERRLRAQAGDVNKYATVIAISKRALQSNRGFMGAHANRGRHPIYSTIGELLEGRLRLVDEGEVGPTQLAEQPEVARRHGEGMFEEEPYEDED